MKTQYLFKFVNPDDDEDIFYIISNDSSIDEIAQEVGREKLTDTLEERNIDYSIVWPENLIVHEWPHFWTAI